MHHHAHSNCTPDNATYHEYLVCTRSLYSSFKEPGIVDKNIPSRTIDLDWIYKGDLVPLMGGASSEKRFHYWDSTSKILWLFYIENG